MPTQKPFPVMLKAFVIALPLCILILGGALAVAYVASLMTQGFAFGSSERAGFPPMTLVIFEITPSIPPVGCLIGFGIVYILTVGTLALRPKQRRFAGIAAGTFVIALWIAVGYQVRSALTGPNEELMRDSDDLN